ncbi:MAG: SRPBCC family protein [Kofleriaceae bacterium]
MESLQAARSGFKDVDRSHIAVARRVGWFSVALGTAEIAMPRAVARFVGVAPDSSAPMILRILGAREIASGIATLAQPTRAWPLWLRAVGDAIDLALLAAAKPRRVSVGRWIGATLAVAAVGAVDVWAARRTRARQIASPVIYAVTINKPPHEVYAFYRDLSRLPEFMDYLESVTEHGAVSHWVAKLPLGKTVAWDAQIVEDRPGELITWQTVKGSPIKLRGRIEFARAPGRNATEVRVEMQMGVRGIGASPALAKLLTKPQVKGDLRRLKQVLETGEVLKSDASVHALPHPAQPATADERDTVVLIEPDRHAPQKGLEP